MTYLLLAALAATIPLPTVVSHADLDLRKATDIRRLDRRIAHAAQDACAPRVSPDPAGMAKARRCRTATIAAATSQRDALVTTARADVAVASTR
jgi:UrcA family protein